MNSETRIKELEDAIKKHRAQKLDDRCWLDDQELYAVLKDGDLGNNSTPPMDKMLENCKNFLTKRCNPSNKWKSYQELEKECNTWHSITDRQSARINYLEGILLQNNIKT